MAKLPTRPMGKQGMEVGMQGYGAMGLTSFYGKPVEDAAGIALMQRAFDLGVTYFDTAEMYTTKVGDKTLYNEELVGKFANKVGRDKVQIGTKFFPSPQKASCSTRVVRDSVEASLKRLGTKYIDLYYLHRIPEEDGVLENFMESVKPLVEEGKIKYVGLSEASPDEIRRAHAIHPLTCIQQEWSMMVRGLEAEVVPTCRELGIAIVAYSPLARGFASAKVKKAGDWNKIGNGGADGQKFQEVAVPYMSGENLEKNAALLAPVEALAEKEKVSPSQISLAWVQAKGVDVFPIPGTTKIENLESNIAAAHLSLKLDKAVFEQLGKDVDVSKIVGQRYAAAMMDRTIEGKAAKRAGPKKDRVFGSADAKGGCDFVATKTALVLIEFQNEFATEGGKMYDAVKANMQETDMLNKTSELVKAARAKGVKIFHTPITFKGDMSDNPNKGLGILKGCSDGALFVEGTWNAEIVKEISQEAGDVYVKGKHGLDAFPGTTLEVELKKNGIETVAIAGFLTNCCCESTMRTAFEKGYNVVTLTDCMSTDSSEGHKAATEGTFTMFSTPMKAEEFKGKFLK